MSVYVLNKILYLLENDADFRRRITTDSEEAIGSFDLTPAERRALTSGDVGSLFNMGVHAFLLNHLSQHRLFGVTADNYLPRIRGEQSLS